MHDWNATAEVLPKRTPRVVDETLRDGLQAASAHDPPVERKLRALHAMAAVGVDAVSVGLPAAGARAKEDAVALACELVRARLPMRATAAGRTTEPDVAAIAEVSQRAGVGIDVYAFIGCSPIRRYVESWSVAWMTERIRVAGDVTRRAGLPFCLVMEDTTRTPPDVLREVFGVAVDAGAARICLCDTVGHADPSGARRLVGFARETLAALGAPSVELDWHGHNDRGLALANALEAARAGASGVHGTAGGFGERTGNVPLEHLVAQLVASGVRAPVSEEALAAYARVATAAHDVPPTHGDEEPLLPLRLRVNGDVVHVGARPSRTLLELLRYDLDLVGTKQGCDEGDCGACTVLLDGVPVLGCLTLAASCAGRDVVTVESLAGAPEPDPLLDAFDRTGAGQCGFCTSGMLMSSKALLAREPRPTRAQVREAISGNLCRCTGYGPIVDAVELAAGTRALADAPPRPGEECAPAPLPSHARRK